MSQPIRILLVDDHRRVHEGINAAIEAFDDLELVAHGSNGFEALQLCAEYHPDLVLMDVMMPSMSGINATALIVERYPQIKVLALSSFQDEESIRDMMRAGAQGYLLKTSSIDELAHTIRAVAAGQNVFSSEVTRVLLQTPSPPPTEDFGLTQREREILKLIINGKSNSEIAYSLTISISTVKFHVSSIIRKLHVDNRVEVVALAIEKKLHL
jgi:two-component system, NarL family, response regulator LiaR